MWTRLVYCSLFKSDWLTASHSHKTTCLLDRNLAARYPTRWKSLAVKSKQIWFHFLGLQSSCSLGAFWCFCKHEKLLPFRCQPNWTSKSFKERKQEIRPFLKTRLKIVDLSLDRVIKVYVYWFESLSRKKPCKIFRDEAHRCHSCFHL